MRRVLCFGNDFIEKDRLALVVARELKVSGFEFVVCISPDELLKHDDIVIMDVAENVKRACLVEAEDLEARPVAMHDLDLGFFIKLAKQLGKPKKIRIIALPQNGNKEKIKDEVAGLLKSI